MPEKVASPELAAWHQSLIDEAACAEGMPSTSARVSSKPLLVIATNQKSSIK